MGTLGTIEVSENEKQIVKEYLSQYYICKKRKQQLERRLREVNAELNDPIGGVNYRTTPRSTTNVVGLGAASLLFRIAEIEERIANQKRNIEKAMLKIMDIMDYLPESSTERMILELRHIDCLSWKDIMREVNLTRTPCNDYYNKGLAKLLEYKKIRIIVNNYTQE